MTTPDDKNKIPDLVLPEIPDLEVPGQIRTTPLSTVPEPTPEPLPTAERHEGPEALPKKRVGFLRRHMGKLILAGIGLTGVGVTKGWQVHDFQQSIESTTSRETLETLTKRIHQMNDLVDESTSPIYQEKESKNKMLVRQDGNIQEIEVIYPPHGNDIMIAITSSGEQGVMYRDYTFSPDSIGSLGAKGSIYVMITRGVSPESVKFSYFIPKEKDSNYNQIYEGPFTPEEFQTVINPSLRAELERTLQIQEANKKLRAEITERKTKIKPEDKDVATKSPENVRRFQTGLVTINMRTSNGGVGSCTGAVLDERTILTARHCVEDGANSAKITSVQKLQFNPNNTVSHLPANVVNPAGETYHVNYPPTNDQKNYYHYLDGSDYAVIVFKNPVFKSIKPVEIEDKILIREDLYYLPHMIGYPEYGNESWKLDSAKMEEAVEKYDNRFLIKLKTGAQGGNSGGPLLDNDGKVVGVDSGIEGSWSVHTLVRKDAIDDLRQKSLAILAKLDKGKK